MSNKTYSFFSGLNFDDHIFDGAWQSGNQSPLTVEKLRQAAQQLRGEGKPPPIPTGDEALRQQLGQLEEQRDRLRAELARERDLRRKAEEHRQVLYRELERRRPVASDSALAAELGKLIVQFHPDRNPGGIDATRIAAELNRLRDLARGKR